MPLDPQARALLGQLAEGPPVHTLTAEQARHASKLRRSKAATSEPRTVASVTDELIPGPAGPLPVRIYRPDEARDRPVLLFFHGGGWVTCDLDSHDGYCRDLTMGARCVVVAVDYRLAPEHPYPAAVEDAYAALRWVASHGRTHGWDERKVGVAGDSAGGNLAAVLTLLARDRGGPCIAVQVLLYPVTDHAESDSYKRHGNGDFVTADAMRWYWKHYLGEADGSDPYASPLRVISMRGLPPALVVVAEFDPLHDEGVAYARRLRAEGVETTLLDVGGMFHGFATLGSTLDKARHVLGLVGCTLSDAFSRPPGTGVG
jgi:acetyl esterase